MIYECATDKDDFATYEYFNNVTADTPEAAAAQYAEDQKRLKYLCVMKMETYFIRTSSHHLSHGTFPANLQK